MKAYLLTFRVGIVNWCPPVRCSNKNMPEKKFNLLILWKIFFYTFFRYFQYAFCLHSVGYQTKRNHAETHLFKPTLTWYPKKSMLLSILSWVRSLWGGEWMKSTFFQSNKQPPCLVGSSRTNVNIINNVILPPNRATWII